MHRLIPLTCENGSQNMHAYCDESGCFNESCQAIGLLSGSPDNLKPLRDDLLHLLSTNGVFEIKFEDVRTHIPKLTVARGFLTKALESIGLRKVRIDVLCWTITDKRHSVPRRDDSANLGRMYYKLLRNISERWHATDWTIYPDEGSSLDWNEVRGYLNATRLVREPQLLTLFKENNFMLKFRAIEPRDSTKEPLIQLADLFAGMTCFSRKKAQDFIAWYQDQQIGRHPMLFEIPQRVRISRVVSNRFEILCELYKEAKEFHLGISLLSSGYLRSFRKESPLNIWHYESKSEYDRAPIKRCDRSVGIR